MKLYDNYFDDYIELTPSLYDCLNLKSYKYLKNKMENPFSSEHIIKQNQLHILYLNKISRIRNPNIIIFINYIC